MPDHAFLDRLQHGIVAVIATMLDLADLARLLDGPLRAVPPAASTHAMPARSS